MYNGFEMADRHRAILLRNRVFLLHNIHTSEIFWSSLLASGVFSTNMIEEIRNEVTNSAKLGSLLDKLPTRGPEAFDNFIECLLESDHSHVAEFLKNAEVTEKFREEIDPHCSNVPEKQIEKLVKIFRKSTPAVQRFAERKFELILEDQAKDIERKENDLKAAENANYQLQMEVKQYQNVMKSCSDVCENIALAIKRELIATSSLKEESEQLNILKNSIKEHPDLKDFHKIFENIQRMTEVIVKLNEAKLKEKTKAKDDKSQLVSTKGKTLQEKIASLTRFIVQTGEELGQKSTVTGLQVRTQIEMINQRFKDVCGDVMGVKDVFHNNMRQKRKLEGEVLALLHIFQEIRRLDTECKEKQSYVNELLKEAQMVKKKIVANSRQSRKLSEQIQKKLQSRAAQLESVKEELLDNIQSADKRLKALLNLLPDLEDAHSNEFLRTDTDMTSEVDSQIESRSGTPTGVKASSGFLEDHTYRKLAQVMGNTGISKNTVNGNTPRNDSKEEASRFEGIKGVKLDVHNSNYKDTLRKGKDNSNDVSDDDKNKCKSKTLEKIDENVSAERKIPAKKKTMVVSNPVTLSRDDIDKWLKEQQQNPHLDRLRNQKTQSLSTQENKSESSSGEGAVLGTISVKETKCEVQVSSSHNEEVELEETSLESKHSGSSSRNNSSGKESIPDITYKSEYKQISMSKINQSRSKYDMSRSQESKLLSLSTEKIHLDKRRNVQPPFIYKVDECNVNLNGNETVTELPASSRVVRKSYGQPREKETVKVNTGREMLTAKRIDLMQGFS